MQLIEQTKHLIEECDASISRFYRQRELDATPHFLTK